MPTIPRSSHPARSTRLQARRATIRLIWAAKQPPRTSRILSWMSNREDNSATARNMWAEPIHSLQAALEHILPRWTRFRYLFHHKAEQAVAQLMAKALRIWTSLNSTSNMRRNSSSATMVRGVHQVDKEAAVLSNSTLVGLAMATEVIIKTSMPREW